MQAKVLTDSSWILINKNGAKLGIAIKSDNGFKILGKGLAEYSSLESIAEHYKEKLEIINEAEKKQEVIEDLNINGYPVKHDQYFNVDEVDGNDSGQKIYTYRSKENGKNIFAAGYFGLKFKNGYVKAFCPKIETILENEFIGPFLTDFDAKFHITKENRS